MVRWMRSQNRVRRIKHFDEKYCQNSGGDYLGGKLRSVRKELPHLNCWKHIPRKIRFRNNGTVNLFCEANQWAGHCERLVDLAR
jgi:hypothetical protein